MKRNRGPPITQGTLIKWGAALVLLWSAPHLLTTGLILALAGLVLVIVNRRFFANTPFGSFELKPNGLPRKANPWFKPDYGCRTSRRRR